ncbi:molybdate transport system substrate-binding protein [Agromyces cerinus]|uniref:molybdate ABC transporter substrate-binding protein n=1 Tax=Agromyces cerinus TaxID=33878 RepID=UPI0019592E48|nr:molybdate ABC transporter substrate-binding protein [Agromyces cerinus]MBM7829800.1 molybdate transport system substrate-binding protein [Agromyces cerinus]
MTRTRRLLVATSAAILAVAFGGCAGVGTAPSADPSGSPNATTSELRGGLTIFAAASLSGAFDELATRFEARHPGLDVAPITYDGSSTLATQLSEGAAADVFASADDRTMATVAEAGLVDGDPATFASNVLEIAVQPGNPLGIDALDDLGAAASAQPLVVLCAPEVPCGHAAQTLFDRAGVDVTPVSEEQNVSAVLTKVRSGEADAGLVYVTDVQAADGAVEGIEIDGADAATNTYPVAALADAANPEAAREFVRFVRSAEGAEVLASFGFGPP